MWNVGPRFVSIAAALLVVSVAGPVAGAPAVPAPAAQVAAKKVPGRTLVVKTTGLPAGTRASVRVKGPKRFTKTRKVGGKVKFKRLRAGKYRLVPGTVAGFRVSPVSKRVRVKARRGTSVTFTYSRIAPPDSTAPGPVTGLQEVARTATELSAVAEQCIERRPRLGPK